MNVKIVIAIMLILSVFMIGSALAECGCPEQTPEATETPEVEETPEPCNPSEEDIEKANRLRSDRNNLTVEIQYLNYDISELNEGISELRDALQYERFMLAYYKYALNHQGQWICPGDVPYWWYWNSYYECVYIYPHGDQYYTDKINETKENIDEIKDDINEARAERAQLVYERSVLRVERSNIQKEINCLLRCICEDSDPLPEAPENDEGVTNSAPSLGIGFRGSVAGDQIPMLYTYVVDGKSVTSTEMPVDHEGPVIVTPARTAGEPLEPNTFDNTAKGKRIAEWRANHAE